MENASKALLMAGGILIAVLIIGVLIYSFGTMSGYFSAEQDIEAAQQLKIFNDQYESYNRKLLRGTDVISVMNKAININIYVQFFYVDISFQLLWVNSKERDCWMIW